jgi:hypothetical protein
MDRSYPAADYSRARLERAGWIVNDNAVITPKGLRWQVTGSHGKTTIEVECDSHSEAWFQACQRAKAVGLLGK